MKKTYKYGMFSLVIMVSNGLSINKQEGNHAFMDLSFDFVSCVFLFGYEFK
ncbi:MAG: hypothetical protein ABIH71_00370 [Candidatus Omnitrophota bacterium]|nr:hypothetical protein [Candidatus Omnitrophota bacterium]